MKSRFIIYNIVSARYLISIRWDGMIFGLPEDVVEFNSKEEAMKEVMDWRYENRSGDWQAFKLTVVEVF